MSFFQYLSAGRLVVLGPIQRLAAGPELRALHKFNNIMILTRNQRLDNIGLAREAAQMINRPENASIKARIQDGTKALMGPVLEKIIDQGSGEGVFDPLPGKPLVGLLLDIPALASQRSIAILESGTGLVETAEGRRAAGEAG